MSAVMTSSLPSGVAVPRSALGPKGWTALMAAVITVVILAPVLNLLAQQGYALERLPLK